MTKIVRVSVQQFVFGTAHELGERTVDFQSFAVQADQRFASGGIMENARQLRACKRIATPSIASSTSRISPLSVFAAEFDEAARASTIINHESSVLAIAEKLNCSGAISPGARTQKLA